MNHIDIYINSRSHEKNNEDYIYALVYIHHVALGVIIPCCYLYIVRSVKKICSNAYWLDLNNNHKSPFFSDSKNDI